MNPSSVAPGLYSYPFSHRPLLPGAPGPFSLPFWASVFLCDYMEGREGRQDCSLSSLLAIQCVRAHGCGSLHDSCLPALRSTLFCFQDAPGPGDGPAGQEARRIENLPDGLCFSCRCRMTLGV